MVDPRSGARAVIRDTRSAAGRFCWSVLAPDQMDPMSDGRTDDSARAQCPSSRRGNGQSTSRGPRAPAHREDVYFRTADFFGGAAFFRGAAFAVGGLRASLTALPAWNRTALLAAIWMASPVCGFRPSRAGRAATSKSRGQRHAPPRRPRGHRGWRLPRPSPPGPPPLGLAQLPERLSRSVRIGSSLGPQL
jgi:hypothetical protein